MKPVRPAPWLLPLCPAPLVPFALPFQLFFLGHAGGASGSSDTLQPFLDPPSKLQRPGVSDHLSLEGLDLVLVFEFTCPTYGTPPMWAEPTPASSYTAVLRRAGGPVPCLYTARDG